MDAQQRDNCLRLVRYLEALPKNLYIREEGAFPVLPLGIRGNALTHAADHGIGGLGLFWPTPRKGIVVKDGAIIVNQAILEEIFGEGIDYEFFRQKTLDDVTILIRTFAQLGPRLLQHKHRHM